MINPIEWQSTPQGLNCSPSLAEKQPSENEVDPDPEYDEAKYPEGGLQSWLVVFGAWSAMIPSMGLLNTIGILHAWLSTHQLKEYSSSTIGWIFGVYGFCLYFAGAQAGMALLLTSSDSGTDSPGD